MTGTQWLYDDEKYKTNCFLYSSYGHIACQVVGLHYFSFQKALWRTIEGAGCPTPSPDCYSQFVFFYFLFSNHKLTPFFQVIYGSWAKCKTLGEIELLSMSLNNCNEGSFYKHWYWSNQPAMDPAQVVHAASILCASLRGYNRSDIHTFPPQVRRTRLKLRLKWSRHLVWLSNHTSKRNDFFDAKTKLMKQQ